MRNLMGRSKVRTGRQRGDAIVAIAVFLSVALLIIGFVSSCSSTVKDWFEPARVVINDATPSDIDVSFHYWFPKLDGPIMVVATDASGTTEVAKYTGSGQWESGDTNTGISVVRHLHITSRSAAPVHFTLRECRIRERWFHWVCE
ncbi:MAG: hypothetical protein ACYDH8_14085 [Syntrophales bacterium]